MIKICVVCGKAFEVDELDRNRNRRRYCGIDCAESAAYERKRDYTVNGKNKAFDVKCEICGRIFRTSYTQKITCSLECQHERKKRLSRENGRLRREAIKNGTLPPTKPKPERKKQNTVETIEEVQRKARAAGMSYGQYMQAEYIRKMQEGRKGNGGC